MTLTYITVTESFMDGTGAPLSANVTLTPSQAVYAGGIPVVTPASPIVAEVVGGQLLGPSGGPLQLLATAQAGLTLMSGTGFWWWQATVQVGQVTDMWQFQLATSPASVELYSTKNTPVIPVSPFLAAKSGSSSIPAAEISPQVVALTDAATIAVNAALGNEMDVTLGGNRTMGAPSNPANGQRLTFRIRQDATGSRTLTWTGGAGGYAFGAGSAPTLSTAASACDLIAFDYDQVKNQWMSLGSALGF